MNNEKYFNYYVETLTNTMTDAIVRNVSLQASVKIAEESTHEYEETIGLLDAEIGRLKDQLEKERISRNQSENSRIRELEHQVNSLNTELNNVKSLKKEYEDVKHQVQHVETFRNELMREREVNERLQKEIEYLKLTPAKRKKIDELNSTKESSKMEDINVKDKVQDGGSF